jgi:hypothetical protein
MTHNGLMEAVRRAGTAWGPLTAIALLTATANWAVAGPNAGGTLLLHANTSVAFTEDVLGAAHGERTDGAQARRDSIVIGGASCEFSSQPGFPPSSASR